MAFEEAREQRLQRVQQFWAAETGEALQAVDDGPVTDALASLAAAREQCRQAQRSEDANPRDLIPALEDLAAAHERLEEAIRYLAGTALMLQVPTRKVAAAARRGRTTVNRWSAKITTPQPAEDTAVEAGNPAAVAAMGEETPDTGQE